MIKYNLGESKMNRIREIREDKGYTQTEIAKKLGITQRNYSYFETGQTMLTEEILNKIANFYNTSIDYLLYRTDIREPYPKSIIKDEKN